MGILRYFWLFLLLLTRGLVAVFVGLVALQVYMMISRQQDFIWEWDLLGFLFLIFCFLALPVAYLYELSNDLTAGKSVLLGGLAGMAYPSMFVFVALTEEPSWEKFFGVATVLGYGLLPGLIAGGVFWATGKPFMDKIKRLKEAETTPIQDGDKS